MEPGTASLKALPVIPFPITISLKKMIKSAILITKPIYRSLEIRLQKAFQVVERHPDLSVGELRRQGGSVAHEDDVGHEEDGEERDPEGGLLVALDGRGRAAEIGAKRDPVEID